MDAKLSSNLEDLEALFNTRMAVYEDKLALATSGSSSAATSSPNLSALMQEFKDFKSFVLQALSKLKSQMELLTLGFDRHETAMRRKVLLIHGIAEEKDEKVNEIAFKVFNHQMRLTELSRENLHVCHRLGSAKRSSRPILVRFYTTEHRHLVWDSKKSLKGTGVTISEFLTQLRHQTFMAARKRFGMTNCWSVEGKIVVITPDKSRHKIESLDELHRLSAKYPVNNDDCVQTEDPKSPPADPISPIAKVQRKTRRRN